MALESHIRPRDSDRDWAAPDCVSPVIEMWGRASGRASEGGVLTLKCRADSPESVDDRGKLGFRGFRWEVPDTVIANTWWTLATPESDGMGMFASGWVGALYRGVGRAEVEEYVKPYQPLMQLSKSTCTHSGRST
jgi:hypothetical protein